ncbi:hypothetical protein J6590_075925 [Homalodisca vitripennis]|nr:hypothetical protein J6590_075925 [Homalodisca vitripennis]
MLKENEGIPREDLMKWVVEADLNDDEIIEETTSPDSGKTDGDEIEGCNQLTEASVDAIVENCRNLRYLDASCCNKMSDKIAELLHRLPAQTFYSRGEPRVSAPVPPPPLLRH